MFVPSVGLKKTDFNCAKTKISIIKEMKTISHLNYASEAPCRKIYIFLYGTLPKTYDFQKSFRLVRF